MGKIHCRCGSPVPDADGAVLLRDREVEAAREAAAGALAEFAALTTPGARRRWAIARFGLRSPGPLADEDVIYHVLAEGARGRGVLRCSECGRLWVQERPGENRWASYLPEPEPGGA